MYEYRCDERILELSVGLNLRDFSVTVSHLTYTGLRWGLEHLKIETRLIDKRFASVMGDCVI